MTGLLSALKIQQESTNKSKEMYMYYKYFNGLGLLAIVISKARDHASVII